MASCPCCSDQMLRHIRHNQTYWFCRSCWQEMPLMQPSLNLVSASLERRFVLANAERSLVTI
ncbi:hypothetical protein H6F93_21885 [Leptolyngbya sp. FACHB-671]|uniref:hypothetical protein n=1 Tax=Leptolyngbya sp. FACHB-671 TaxID=2692812 RepID=UPI001681EC07|nr:hypothetical protein [Leptolyngbya sp. FACHB-671]MBD1870666.1 hypothetical protein [Cyanobacteria bacterium FACHB-471]MBD2070129.1 hypothetical protein [Leptolyngbya sp. FACHB-671]